MPVILFSPRLGLHLFSLPIFVYYHQLAYYVSVSFCMLTDKLSNGFILIFSRQCLLLCVALKTSDYWSASIGHTSNRRPYIYANHSTTKLSYVCQYHSKPLHGLSGLSIIYLFSKVHVLIALPNPNATMGQIPYSTDL